MTTDSGQMSSSAAREPLPAQVVLRAFEHRHEILHLIYTAANEADAVRRIGQHLGIDPAAADAILDLPFRDLLPHRRAQLERQASAGGG
jgi:DNA gyrase/topoisomerase IV subunit A